MREPRIRGPLLRAGLLFRSNRYLGPYRKLPNTLVRAVFDFTGIFLRKTDLLRFSSQRPYKYPPPENSVLVV
jgi:hypothetical protein